VDPTPTPEDDTPSDTEGDSENPQDPDESSTDQPTDSSEPTDSEQEPTPTEPEPEPTTPEENDGTDESSGEPQPEESTTPETDNQEQDNQSQETSSDNTPQEVITDALSDGKLTAEEKAVVVDALVSDLAPGEALSAEGIAEAGVTFEDLPPETPVELRTDEEGNAVIITAEVAAALVLLENPAELLGELFSDPGQVLLALGSIGADMSPQEREESQKTIVAAVIVGQIATVAAVGAATSAASQTSRRP